MNNLAKFFQDLTRHGRHNISKTVCLALGLAVSCIAAWIISSQWLKNFSERIALTPLPFIAVIIAVMALIAAVVVINSYKIATSNPVNYLKDE